MEYFWNISSISGRYVGRITHAAMKNVANVVYTSCVKWNENID